MTDMHMGNSPLYFTHLEYDVVFLCVCVCMYYARARIKFNLFNFK